MRQVPVFQVAAAALTGVFYAWVAIEFWASYALSSPVRSWLLAHFDPRDHATLLPSLIRLHDVLLNLLLAAPFAALLLFVARRGGWHHVVVAAIVALLYTYRPVDMTELTVLSSHPDFWLGLVTTALSLPLAFFALRSALPARPHPAAY